MGTKHRTFRRNSALKKKCKIERLSMGKLGEVSSALSNLPRYSNGVGIDFFFLINDLCSETIQSASQR